jgi:hypothetical protein
MVLYLVGSGVPEWIAKKSVSRLSALRERKVYRVLIWSQVSWHLLLDGNAEQVPIKTNCDDCARATNQYCQLWQSDPALKGPGDWRS